jgi:hypothetical protein
MSKHKTTKKGFERKVTKDGTPNPKYVDVLKNDAPIAGQEWGCFSFISPEKILKQREMFFFEEFVKQWEMNKSMEKFHQFLNFISFKYKLIFDEVIKDFESFVKEERETIIQSSFEDDYKNFLDREEEELFKQFNIKHNFQTSVRCFKSRGHYASKEEAELHSKLLRESDPAFDIFIGPVGTWLQCDPEPYKTGRVEYMEEEMNQLAHEKRKNEEIAKAAFEQRRKEAKQTAIEENKKNASKYGSVITQDINEEGELIGVGNTSTEQSFSTKKQESISVADIRNELFDGDNIVVGKTDYGQSKLTSGPFAKKTD